MAIHPTFPGLSAGVVVNGLPLAEYNDDEDENEELPLKMVTKYIPAESDTNFSLPYTIPKDLNGPFGIRVKLMVDGKYLLYKTHTHKDIARSNVRGEFVWMTTNTQQGTYKQKFRFSALSINENAADLDKQLLGQLKIVGVLALKFEFINNITREQCKPKPPGNFDPAQKLPLIGTLPEKSLKGDARSHQASFDAPTFHSAYVPKETGSREVFHTGEPFAIFQFKYRSLAALRALRLLPRTPSPPPLSPPRRGTKAKASSQRKSAAGASNFKQERMSRVKREAPVSDDEVEFVSDKRVKGPPKETDEVIVLD
ncbi:hypothetical protein HBI23_168510 [Parastagonospora nodorum]|nr:hypothetical protein HBI47_032310 [Parastagonospora nodorum]KAH5651708.1 hypothetical protein HBI23_168510 [Parastagonospora nodorum]